MNLHAKKIVQESSAEYEINTYQGRLLEFHACPNCELLLFGMLAVDARWGLVLQILIAHRRRIRESRVLA